MAVVYLNGAFVEREKASVSVMDRGFLLGDGVYEVIPAYFGKLFRFQEHLSRLQKSLDAVSIPNPHRAEEWESILGKLVDLNGRGDLSVYLQITRGTALHRDHAFPAHVTPTVFAMATPIVVPGPEYYENGVAAMTLEDVRWRHCDIKAISLLPNVLLRQQAVAQGMSEAILVRDGAVTEGAASNVFVISRGVLKTPPPSPAILTGITRDLVLELAKTHNVKHEECAIPVEELRQADEIWLTSSTKEIVPVTLLDGQAVGAGKPGPVWRQMCDYYREYKEALAQGRVQ